MTYEQRFNATQAKLTEAGAEFHEEDCQLILTEGERQYHAEHGNFRISDELFEFFNSLNGPTYRWNVSDAARSLKLSGYFMFHDFITFMENPSENKLWVDGYEADDIAEMKQHRILESLHGNDAYVTLKLKADGSHSLYFVDGDRINHGGSRTLPEIPLSLKQYFEVVTGYFGVYSVRYHLHKPDFYTRPEKYIPELEQLKALIPGFKPPDVTPIGLKAPRP